MGSYRYSNECNPFDDLTQHVANMKWHRKLISFFASEKLKTDALRAARAPHRKSSGPVGAKILRNMKY